jgi:PST family polysaccharide transporter
LLGVEQAAPYLRVIGVVFVVRNLTLGDFLMTRELRFRELGLIELTGYLIGYGVVAVVFASRGAGAWALVAGQIGQTAIRTALVVARCRHPAAPSLRWNPLKELLGYGAGNIIARLANFTGNQADNVVVGRLLGATALGFYGRAYQMMRLPSHMFGQVMSEVLFPAMAKIQDDGARLGRAFLNASAITALVALPASALAALLSRELVLTLLGGRWLEAAPAFLVMAWGIVFSAGSKLSDALARATGAVYRRAWRQLAYAAAIVAGSYAGARFGITGVAVGVLAANVVNFLLMAHLSLLVTQSSWSRYAGAHLPALILATGTMAAAWPAAGALRLAGAPAELTLAGALLAAALAGLVLARIAPRIGPAHKLAEVIGLALAPLGGKARKVALTVLGSAYSEPALHGTAG